MPEQAVPTTIVIFGGSGDLSRRKLMPALFNLYQQGRLPADFRIVGFASTKRDADNYHNLIRTGLDEFMEESYSEAEWDAFADHLHYFSGSFKEAADFAALRSTLDELEPGASNRLYYLATPPNYFADIVAQLGAADMVKEADAAMDLETDDGPAAAAGAEEAVWRRVVIEKPFGYNLASAQALNQALHAVLAEHQIYRIDHYLAKETVQNILVFRFGNIMFEPIWNRNYVDHVQITMAETVDVGHRGAYYDQAGVLCDMFQNHLMQLLSLVAMEPPASFEADAVRDEKVKTLRAIRPLAAAEISGQTVRAQYDGYLKEKSVDPASETPTFAALEMYIDNWRWQDVPFYLRSGKALAEKSTEITIQFKRPPHQMFPTSLEIPLRSNFLTLCIQPHEGFHQQIEAKEPGQGVQMCAVDMEFDYDEAFHPDSIPEAYETLLLNALEGDATLFTRSDGIEAAWRVIDPILQAWRTDDAPPLTTYARGSWGPEEADRLLARDGREWRYTCSELD